MLLKRRFLLTVFSIFILIVSSIASMEHDRRTQKYNTIIEYLDSFSEGRQNHGKPKILIIGGGLAYDDMVQGSDTLFFKNLEISWEKQRPHYYPKNTYLVDLDGKFYYLDQKTDFSSLSDLHANIVTKEGFSDEFNGKFDIIILEYLSYEALKGSTFKNCWSFLKEGGIIITNNHISNEPFVRAGFVSSETYQDLLQKQDIDKFSVFDPHHKEITVHYFLAGIISVPHHVFYMYTIHQEVETAMDNPDSNDYKIDIHNKLIEYARSEPFLQKLIGFYNKKAPTFPFTSIEFTKNPNYWYAPPDSSGYLVWKK